MTRRWIAVACEQGPLDKARRVIKCDRDSLGRTVRDVFAAVNDFRDPYRTQLPTTTPLKSTQANADPASARASWLTSLLLQLLACPPDDASPTSLGH
jgi:hypothetical protein